MGKYNKSGETAVNKFKQKKICKVMETDKIVLVSKCNPKKTLRFISNNSVTRPSTVALLNTRIKSRYLAVLGVVSRNQSGV